MKAGTAIIFHGTGVDGPQMDTDVLNTWQILSTYQGTLLARERLLGTGDVSWPLTVFLSRAREAVLDFELGTAGWHGQMSKGPCSCGRSAGRSAVGEGKEPCASSQKGAAGCDNKHCHSSVTRRKIGLLRLGLVT